MVVYLHSLWQLVLSIEKNEGKCLAGTDSCFNCGKSGNKMRNVPILKAKGKEGKKSHHSFLGSNSFKKTNSMHFRLMGYKRVLLIWLLVC